jgi:hypothetical protein
MGRFGRNRPGHASGERARVAAKKAIDRAIRAISEQDPYLGAELGTRIDTGGNCCYTPDPIRPLSWIVDAGSGVSAR